MSEVTTERTLDYEGRGQTHVRSANKARVVLVGIGLSLLVWFLLRCFARWATSGSGMDAVVGALYLIVGLLCLLIIVVKW